MSEALFQLHKMFGPVRRFVYLPNNEFVYLLKAPGFSKEDLAISFTGNNLIRIVGDKTVAENGHKLHRFRLDELVHIPRDVQREHISWSVENGCAIFKCHRGRS